MVQEGPQSIVDHILIIGNVHTKPDVILRELQFKPGQPIGLQDQFESRRRLSALGLFRRVQITELTHGSGSQHDVLVTVEEAPATTVGYGGGVEAYTKRRSTGPDGQAEDQLEFAPRGFFDIGRRNLFGANRSVNLYTRVSLRPRDAPDDPEVDGTGIGLSEYRIVGTYRQPSWFGANDLTVNGVVEQGVRTSFNFARQGVNLDVVRRLTPALRVSGRYSLSSTRTFDERLTEEDQASDRRALSRRSACRDSPEPWRATRATICWSPLAVCSSAGKAAWRRARSAAQVGFMKTYVQGFTFRRLPGRRTVVVRVARGAWPRRRFRARGAADRCRRQPDPRTAHRRSTTLPASERFYAGGDTTIRGFALDSVGAPNTISANGYPTGGNAVLLLNGELRFPVWRDLRRRGVRRRRQRVSPRDRVRSRRAARQLRLWCALPFAGGTDSRRPRIQDGSPCALARTGRPFIFSLGQAF